MTEEQEKKEIEEFEKWWEKNSISNFLHTKCKWAWLERAGREHDKAGRD